MTHFWKPLTWLFSAPVFDDPERQRTARMLQWILGGSFLILVPVMVLTALVTPMPQAILLLQGLMMLGAVIGLYLVRSGQILVVSVGFAALIWLVVTFLAAIDGGIGAPSLVGYPIVVLMAGFFLGRREAVAAALLSVLAAAGLVWAESAQLLSTHTPTLMQRWVTVTGGLAGVALFMHIGLLADEERRTTAARLRLALEAGQVGTWEWDVDGNRVLWSDNVDAITGRRRTSLDGSHSSYLDLVHEDDRATVERALRATIEENVPFAMDHRIRRPDGSVRWVAGRGEASELRAPHAVRLVGTITDITEQRAAQERLAQSRHQLAEAQRIAKTGSFEWNVEDNTVEWSDEFRRMYGVGDDSPSLEGFKKHFHPEDVEMVDQAVAAVVERGVPLDIHHRVVRPDGTTGVIHVRGESVENAAGSVVEMVGFAQDVTELWRAEEALRESEDKYRMLFEASPVGMGFAELGGRILAFNDAILEPGGFVRSDITPSTKVDDLYYDPDDIVRVRALLEGQGFVRDEEVKFKRKDGGFYEALLSVNMVTVKGQQCALAIVQDISARARAERALQTSEARFRALYEQAAISMVQAEPDGRFLGANRRFCDLLGYTDDQLKTMLLSDVTHPDDRAADEANLESALAGQQSTFSVEKRYIHADGSVVWTELSATLVTDVDGETPYWIGAMTDITERKRAEDALQNREERLRQALVAAEAGAWEWNIATGEVSWSDENYRVLGLDPSVGPPSYQMWFNAVHPDDREAVEISVAEALERRENLNLELRIVRPDGTVRWINDVGRLRFDEHGEPSSMFGIQLDVTERRATEDAVRRSRGQLRRLAARLQDVREEERTAIAREIHDELGQALTGIKMDLSWLIGRLPRTWKRAHVRADALQNLIDSTIESVRDLSARLRPSVLDDLGLDAAMEWLAHDVERRTNLQVVLETALSDTVLDRERATALFRIVQEALTNVVRHAEASKVDIRLRVDEGTVVVSIADNGKGMRGNELDSGTSLGLIGMRERVGALGGRVTFANGAHGGTVVTAWVPIEDEPVSS